MAKAKYTKNSRGEYETKIWDGTYNVDGSKHRKRLVSRKSSADLERQVNQLKSEVENGQYVQNTDVTFLEYARSWLKTKKAAREMKAFLGCGFSDPKLAQNSACPHRQQLSFNR